jgi:hypothetical protein
MKKIIAIITALMLCASIMVPAFAVDDFVSSVVNPLAPEIVPVIDPNGDPAAGVVQIEDEIIDYVPGPCIVVTPVSRGNTSTMILEDARELLLDVYDHLFIQYSKAYANCLMYTNPMRIFEDDTL